MTCSILIKSLKTGSRFIDLTGRKFGRLEIVGLCEIRKSPNGRSNAFWNVICDCGTKRTVSANHLKSGHTTSCGCAHRKWTSIANSRHGGSKTVEYRIWAGILNRCLNKSTPEYKYYGGRGISFHPSWMQFENFLADMGNRPSRKHTIERVNNDGNYDICNCKWATRLEQARNTRRNLKVTISGVTKCLSEWIEHPLVLVPYNTAYMRLVKYGWTPTMALFHPVRISGRWHK